MTLPRISAYSMSHPFRRLTDVRGFVTEAEAVAHVRWLRVHGTPAEVVVGVHSRDELMVELRHQRDRYADKVAGRNDAVVIGRIG